MQGGHHGMLGDPQCILILPGSVSVENNASKLTSLAPHGLKSTTSSQKVHRFWGVDQKSYGFYPMNLPFWDGYP